jgi:hypothetical protein
MPPRKAAGGEGSKKAQGQARKAEAADQKKAGKQKQVEEVEAQEWEKGAKSNSKALGFSFNPFFFWNHHTD